MRRITLAMSLGLGFGLAVAGCGPTVDEPAPKPSSNVAEGTPKAPHVDEASPKGGPGMGAMKGGSPGGGGMGGPPGDVMKGMQSEAYRKMMGSQGPGEVPKAKGAESKAVEEPKKPAEETKKEPVALSEEELTNIKKLAPEDQKLALAQGVCLVGEDEGKPNHLGSMGTPIKETVKGKTVFLCCKGCVDDLKKDPDKYLAKLPK